jgi:hypothetical protein
LGALSPPGVRCVIRPIYVEWLSKTREYRFKYEVLHSDSTNICLIRNLAAGDERVAKTAQSTYRSCHDTVRNHIDDWTKSGRNRKMESRSRLNLAENLQVYILAR